ncbi:DUF4145 domain-containing protein [Vibrio parahaemolyticus]|nr:DUF4145 domain-containing protein [Vibrio parahaemolyticus]EGY8744463.1 DUF4145 domain-containing protein [Vibrio parahaemolyticus]EHE6936421.1 DUF4145 domain-containing protein [Vibrio parahaemolyticus]EJE4692179.1 DUF4145 domain-containing protein [Vibrio parahaemolyticus]EJK2426993.1 DUF4145 domain-containing protein [Vibrio parahaemolyticus]
MSKEKLKNQCISCNQTTWHQVEGRHQFQSNPDYDYHYMIEHLIVKCCGCESVSFALREHDIELAYLDDEDEWIVPITTEIFPKKNKGSLLNKSMPDIVQNIYRESCNAYRDGALTLASIGFRATIEAVCNEQNIAGKELSTRINNLASKGLISKKDSARLHSIRFLGNDAAHDIKTPDSSSLDAALIIVEHLLTTLYVLDSESKGKLEEIIEDFDLLIELLDKKLSEFKKGEELPLQKILGKDIRRISGNIKNVEKELNARIGKKQYQKLSFGKVGKYQGSKDDLQHYIIA